jgi:oligopeptide transport system permease protein
MPLVLLVLVTITFFLTRAAPGSPFAAERVASPAVLANLKARYGENNAPIVQYAHYLERVVFHGDLGPSFIRKDTTVNEILATEIGATAVLGACATILAVALGMTAGVIGAIRQNSLFDYAGMSVATFGMSIPAFVTGPMLVLCFAMMWKVLPVSGFSDDMTWWPLAVVAAAYVAWRVAEAARAGRAGITLGREAAAFWLFALVGGIVCVATLLAKNRSMILPSVVLALPFASRIARLMRAGMLEVINQDYVRTARAKGLAEHTVVLRHALKGGILPVVSYLGPAISGIVMGSLVVERIFSIPGIGREFVESAFARDYMVVLGVVILDGLLLVVFNLIVDVVYGVLDPRIRYD